MFVQWGTLPILLRWAIIFVVLNFLKGLYVDCIDFVQKMLIIFRHHDGFWYQIPKLWIKLLKATKLYLLQFPKIRIQDVDFFWLKPLTLYAHCLFLSRWLWLFFLSDCLPNSFKLTNTLWFWRSIDVVDMILIIPWFYF